MSQPCAIRTIKAQSQPVTALFPSTFYPCMCELHSSSSSDAAVGSRRVVCVYLYVYICLHVHAIFSSLSLSLSRARARAFVAPYGVAPTCVLPDLSNLKQQRLFLVRHCCQKGHDNLGWKMVAIHRVANLTNHRVVGNSADVCANLRACVCVCVCVCAV